MLTSLSITFIAIYVLEATFIIIGNTFTIFVFWTQTSHLKRSYFLLINLAVADLLVGIAESILLGTEKIPTFTPVISRRVYESTNNPSAAFQLSASSTSVFFLALISLERAFAVLWPVRHHVVSNRAYTCSIAIVWAVGFCMFGLCVLSLYHTKVESKYVYSTIHSCLFISLLVICASYLKIRTRLHSPPPAAGDLRSHSRQSAEHNVRLSRTIFLVTGVSLMVWFPGFVVYTMRDFCHPPCFSPTVVLFVNILHLANSMVNPFVYSFRMAIFKDALKKFLGRRRQNHIDMALVRANKQVGFEFRRFIYCKQAECRVSLQRTGNLSNAYLRRNYTFTLQAIQKLYAHKSKLWAV